MIKDRSSCSPDAWQMLLRCKRLRPRSGHAAFSFAGCMPRWPISMGEPDGRWTHASSIYCRIHLWNAHGVFYHSYFNSERKILTSSTLGESFVRGYYIQMTQRQLRRIPREFLLFFWKEWIVPSILRSEHGWNYCSGSLFALFLLKQGKRYFFTPSTYSFSVAELKNQARQSVTAERFFLHSYID